MTRRKPVTIPFRHEEPPRPGYVLRKADVQDMIDEGSIGNQHFLIQILADGLVGKEAAR